MGAKARMLRACLVQGRLGRIAKSFQYTNRYFVTAANVVLSSSAHVQWDAAAACSSPLFLGGVMQQCSSTVVPHTQQKIVKNQRQKDVYKKDIKPAHIDYRICTGKFKKVRKSRKVTESPYKKYRSVTKSHLIEDIECDWSRLRVAALVADLCDDAPSDF